MDPPAEKEQQPLQDEAVQDGDNSQQKEGGDSPDETKPEVEVEKEPLPAVTCELEPGESCIGFVWEQTEESALIKHRCPDNFSDEYCPFDDSRPVVYGIEYYINFLNNSELTERINSFIAEACEDMERLAEEAVEYMKKRNERNGYDSFCFPCTSVGNKTVLLPVSVSVKCRNGYLSVTVSSMTECMDGDGSYHPYDSISATYDLRTGKKLELSDLFVQGTDFAERLSRSLAEKIAEGVGEYGMRYELTEEFIALEHEDAVTGFTYDSVVFTSKSRQFYLGYDIHFDCNDCLAEQGDPMDGLFKDYVYTSRSYKSTLRKRLIKGSGLVSGGSGSGTYIPNDADPALKSVAEKLSDYIRSFITKDILLQAAADSGMTDITDAAFNCPRYLIYLEGETFYINDNLSTIYFELTDADCKTVYIDAWNPSDISNRLRNITDSIGKQFLFSAKTDEYAEAADCLTNDWEQKLYTSVSVKDGNASFTGKVTKVNSYNNVLTISGGQLYLTLLVNTEKEQNKAVFLPLGYTVFGKDNAHGSIT